MSKSFHIFIFVRDELLASIVILIPIFPDEDSLVNGESSNCLQNGSLKMQNGASTAKDDTN